LAARAATAVPIILICRDIGKTIDENMSKNNETYQRISKKRSDRGKEERKKGKNEESNKKKE